MMNVFRVKGNDPAEPADERFAGERGNVAPDDVLVSFKMNHGSRKAATKIDDIGQEPPLCEHHLLREPLRREFAVCFFDLNTD